jgi:hypothetical protein
MVWVCTWIDVEIDFSLSRSMFDVQCSVFSVQCSEVDVRRSRYGRREVDLKEVEERSRDREVERSI